MMLDLRLLLTQLPLVLLLLAALLVVKAAIVALIVRAFVHNTRKALRTGITVCMGGELGFALLTVLLNGRLAPTELVQPLLTAVVLSMLIGPLLVRYNGRIADRLLGRESTLPSDGVFETVATREIAKREHVIICGFGRVGQNLARVLEKRGFEFIALDLDPFRVRDARQAGDPVVYGDATQVDVLRALGLDRASVVVISVDALEPATRDRARRAPVAARTFPCWCAPRTTADWRLLQAAGATEVVPEIFETSLSIVSHVLLYLDVAPADVAELTEDIRHDRYALLRSVFRRRDARDPDPGHALLRQHLRTVTLPPAAYGVGRTLKDLGLDAGRVVVNALRRDGIVGRDPDPATLLREGDVVVLFGSAEDLEQAESRLLMG